MAHLIDKDALVAEIERRRQELRPTNTHQMHVDEKMDRDVLMWLNALAWVKKLLNTLEVKEVDLMIHTIIAECCDWLAMNTNLSHDEIEGCRNLMLTVKDEQLKAQKGE